MPAPTGPTANGGTGAALGPWLWAPLPPYRLYELELLTPDGFVRFVRVRTLTVEQATELVLAHFPDWEIWSIHCWDETHWVPIAAHQEPCPDCGRLVGHAPNCPRDKG
jgi:hypothetical protein